MASTSTSTQPTNYSLLAIPAYAILATIPHAYSVSLLKPKPNANAKSGSFSNIYNNGNPRSSQNKTHYAANLAPETYELWERARAAHENMLENSAYVVGAVLAGVMTRCEAGWMNRMVGWYLASRVAYTISYLGVRRGPLSVLRTLWFNVGNVVLFSIYWAAGKKVMAGEY